MLHALENALLPPPLKTSTAVSKKIGPDEARLLDCESLADIQQGNSVLRKYRLSFYRKL